MIRTNRIFVMLLSMIIILSSLGCSFGAYSDTPVEAYLKDPYISRPSGIGYDTVKQEIACLQIKDDQALFLALVNDDCLVEAFLSVKDGSYKVNGKYGLYDFNSGEFDSAHQDLEVGYSSVSCSDGQKFYWRIFFFENETELELDEKYSIEYYEIPYKKDTIYVVLAYYFD